MYDHTVHIEKKHFCCSCSHFFSTEKILKSHISDCFKINDKQMIQMPKESEYVKFENMKEKWNHHLWFMKILKVF